MVNNIQKTYAKQLSQFFMVLVVALQVTHAHAGAKDNAVTTSTPQAAVLVTGASSGIGRRIAEVMAERGVHVFAGARKKKDLEELNSIPNIEAVRLDVTEQSDIDAAVAQVKKANKSLSGIVNNAGVFLQAPLIEVSEQEMQFMMDVNLFGPYRVTKAFAPLLIESKGRVTTIGSVASHFAGPLFGPYSMSKAAMQSYTDALSSELAKFDVQVSIVDPGNFSSNIMANMSKRATAKRQQNPDSLYLAEYEMLADFTQADRSHHADPIAVANAVYHATFAEVPKSRYLVTPNAGEATMSVRAILRRLVQLNTDHPYSLTRAQLIEQLDGQLAAVKE